MGAVPARPAQAHGGRDIEPSIPIAMRAKPFSIRGFLGLEGERWVPVHGVFPMSKAQDVVKAVDAFFAERQSRLDAHDIHHSYLSSINGQFWLLEPMFYWMDEVPEFHMRYLDRKRYAKFDTIPANPDARAAVMEVRTELRDLFPRLGCGLCANRQVLQFARRSGARDLRGADINQRSSRSRSPPQSRQLGLALKENARPNQGTGVRVAALTSKLVRRSAPDRRRSD